MIALVKKLFGGINLSWPKLVIAAVAAGVFTAAMAIIPSVHYTSFNAITTTMEVWVLFGILIIMNSKSNMDAALKCFVFFLISQPLVYLIQVPFSSMGWGLFGYYPYWLAWTVLCLPMGYIGYYMKQDKWWGYLILLPLIVITAISYHTYLAHFLFYMPKYVLICLFCLCGMILYPVLIFKDKRIRVVGAVIGVVLGVVLTLVGLLNPPIYRAEIMTNTEEHAFDESYSVSLSDDSIGSVEIIYLAEIEEYAVQAEFKKAGKTILTLESPDGEKKEYKLSVERDTYEIS